MRVIPLILATSICAIGAAEQDKSAYSLFNPTPKALMRDLSTDRPDTTESPYSVDAGHFQVEIEALSVGRDTQDGLESTTLSSSVNAKVGLDNRSDLQFVLEVYRSEEVTGTGVDEDASGLGDMDIRYKFNLWGNDGGMTAAAVMPFITLPTHSDEFGEDKDVTGGLILPLAVELDGGWGLGIMLEIDVVRNEANTGYVGSILQSITVAHEIAGDLGGFLEVVGISSADSEASTEAYFDAGLTYGVGDDLQFDAGTNIGLTEASEDVRFFVGVSIRR